MSILSSGMWCDLCKTPILTGNYWDIGLPSGVKLGERIKGHACDKCQKEYQHRFDVKDGKFKEGE